MIKVVLDANIFVSAILKTPSRPARIFELVEKGKIELLTSLSILQEAKQALLYPKLQKLHHHTIRQIEELLNGLTGFAKFTPEILEIKIIKDDPTDDKYLECAVEGEADFIISGDHHLKNLRVFQEIKIVSPAEFINLLSY